MLSPQCGHSEQPNADKCFLHCRCLSSFSLSLWRDLALKATQDGTGHQCSTAVRCPNTECEGCRYPVCYIALSKQRTHILTSTHTHMKFALQFGFLPTLPPTFLTSPHFHSCIFVVGAHCSLLRALFSVLMQVPKQAALTIMWLYIQILTDSRLCLTVLIPLNMLL